MPAPSSEELLALGRAFMECRVLLTAAELDLFTWLASDARTADEVTAHVGGEHRAVTILLDALAGMGLLAKRDGRYRCPPDVSRYLAAGGAESIWPMLRHMEGLWRSWSALTGVVRGDQEAYDQAHRPMDADYQRAFIEAMHVVSRERAVELAEVVDPGGARALLDIGGGPGTYTEAFLRAAPALRATLFDLPAVVEIADERLPAELLERVTLCGGDFEHDDLPAGHDLALLSAIIHQNSPVQNVVLFRKVWAALDPGGRLIIRDHVMSPDRVSPREGAVFAVNMLVRTIGGNCYTLDEIAQALGEAGFTRIRLLRADDARMNAVVEAHKPEA